MESGMSDMDKLSKQYSATSPLVAHGRFLKEHNALTSDVVLDVKNLSVNFTVYGGDVMAVRDVSFHVRKGETLCIVGESGCGKSVTMQAVMGILPMPPAKILAGEAWFNGDIRQNLIALSKKERRNVLGKDIAMIFQDPLASLNPTMTVQDQIEETLVLHTDISAEGRRARVLELLNLVRIPEPEARLRQFPHELSGGMRQRVMIAMALACNPKIVIADEPTTALDVTIQAQILNLLKDLGKRLNMATILITHDLGVVARMADRVVVMYAGKIVEEGMVDDIFSHPRHPYTIGLRQAIPPESGEEQRALKSIKGTPPDLFAPPPGCAFAARCEFAMVACHKLPPPEMRKGAAAVSCWLHANVEAATKRRDSAGIYPM